MTIAMSEQVDAEPCDVLRGSDGPVYFLLGGRLYVVHEVLGRWIEPDVPRRADQRDAAAKPTAAAEKNADEKQQPESGRAGSGGARLGRAQSGKVDPSEPPQVEHWLVVASVGRYGTPAVFRLQRRPAPPANGPDVWTVRAERR